MIRPFAIGVICLKTAFVHMCHILWLHELCMIGSEAILMLNFNLFACPLAELSDFDFMEIWKADWKARHICRF